MIYDNGMIIITILLRKFESIAILPKSLSNFEGYFFGTKHTKERPDLNVMKK